MDFKKYVSAIEIVFGNLESVIFHVDLVDSLVLRGLRSTYICHSLKDKSPLENVNHSCDSVELGIKYKEESDLSFFPSSKEEPMFETFVSNINEYNEPKQNILGRILYYNDIISLELLDDDNDALFCINVPYEGEDENESMTWNVDKLKKLIHIQIERY